MPPTQFKTVEDFLASLDPSLKPALLELRALILAVDPSVREGIKWNCLSFYTSEYFAALNLHRSKGQLRVLLVLHAGARPGGARTVPDPQGLLEWLGPDRAVLREAGVLGARADALTELLRAWISAL